MADTDRAVVDAWIDGYPLVLMDITRQVTGHSPNEFHHQRAFPDPTFTDVVAPNPNTDTLSSTAWLDLRAEPVILSIPPTPGRYFVISALSGWTEVFAAPGTRTTGDQAADLAFCPPGWAGDLPREVTRVDAPTSMVWLLGRIETAGTRDYLAVHAIQDLLLLTPLSAYDADQPAPRPVPPWPVTADTTPPVDQVARMDGVTFFRRLRELLVDNPPVHDAPVDDPLALDAMTEEAMLAAPAAGLAEVRRVAARLGEENRVDGWSFPRGLGRYGHDHARRAATALVGLGAGLDEDTLSLHTSVDSDGRALTGAHSYHLHFPPEGRPPVGGFWSLTLYNDKQLLVDNPIDRYAIGDRDGLPLDPDGSLDIVVSHDEPATGPATWLPAPTGAFSVVLRASWPDAAMRDGSWRPPVVLRLP